MPLKDKLNLKFPPHKDYCPVCNNKIEVGSWKTLNFCDKDIQIAHKWCDSCGANWDIEFRLTPVKFSNIHVCTQFEDVELGGYNGK